MTINCAYKYICPFCIGYDAHIGISVILGPSAMLGWNIFLQLVFTALTAYYGFPFLIRTRSINLEPTFEYPVWIKVLILCSHIALKYSGHADFLNLDAWLYNAKSITSANSLVELPRTNYLHVSS